MQTQEFTVCLQGNLQIRFKKRLTYFPQRALQKERGRGREVTIQ